MGGASGKLRAWAGYEYGTAVGNLSGHCARCREAHRLLPVKKPPCDRLPAQHPKQCPKYRLYPEHHGLHPKNALAVQLYSLATRDQRAGMEGVLIGTLSAADAQAVIDLYSMHLPSALHRQRAFELMLVLDRAITERRRERERMEAEGAKRRNERTRK